MCRLSSFSKYDTALRIVEDTQTHTATQKAQRTSNNKQRKTKRKEKQTAEKPNSVKLTFFFVLPNEKSSLIRLNGKCN